MAHVTFIHGIANKPSVDTLLKIWLKGLSDDIRGNDDSVNLSTTGVSVSMIYWADVLYQSPIEEKFFESANLLENTVEANYDEDPDMSWMDTLTSQEKKLVDNLAAKLCLGGVAAHSATFLNSAISDELERIPLPWFVKRRLMKILLKDVHHYLFNYRFSPRPGVTFQVRDEIRTRVLKSLKESSAKGEPHIVVSHSMGTVIMYDCLQRVPDCPKIDALMTIGSPLGIDEIQDMLRPEWSSENGYPQKVTSEWINIYDPLDPVTGFDGNIANDFKKNGEDTVKIIREENWGAWRHSITNYLSMPKFRESLVSLLNN